MPGTPRSAASSRRTWRGQAVSGRSSTKAKKVNRVLLSLLGLALAGLLAWLLLRWIFLPTVHFACLPVIEYDLGAVPPIPFCEEDIEAFRRLSPQGPQHVPRLEDLQVSESIRGLANHLAGGSRDTLILYVNAHGVSDDGTAYLLCSDYLRPDKVGRHKLADLLEQIKQSPAELKLLILDVGHLPADPRLGMVLNEFPRLLERLLKKELENVKDPNLWVLAGNRSLETSHVSYSAKRSVFGYYLVEGLEGAADYDRDGMVELAELFDFVRNGVAGWMKRNGGGPETQTPWLLQGVPGTAQPPESLDLLPVSDRSQEDQSQAGDAEDVREDVRNLLNQACVFVDEMQDRGGEEPWSPVDYAPHLWRAYQELLLGYELRYCCGAAFKAEDLRNDLTKNILRLKELIKSGAEPSGVDKQAVFGRLMEARRQSLAEDATVRSQQAGEEVAAVTEMIHLKNDLVFRAPYYVRWHSRASRTSDRPLLLYQPISDLLKELTRFVGQLEALENASLAGESRGAMQEKLADLRETRLSLEALRRDIEDSGLEKDAVELADNLKKNQGNASRVEGLLSIPCLPPARRMELLDELVKLNQPLPEPPESRTGLGPKAPPAPTWQWDRLREQAELEAGLVRLADPAAAAQLALPGKFAGADDPQATKNLWEDYRKFGKQLGDFYRGLPDEIETRLASPDPQKVPSWERLLRLADARDATQISKQVNSSAVRRIRFPVPPAKRLIVDGPKETLELTPDGPTPFGVTVRRAGLSSNDAWVTLKYNPNKIAIERVDNGRPVAPDKPVRISLQQARTTLEYTATPKVETNALASVEFVVEADGRKASGELKFQLPPPDVVILQVRRIVSETGGTTARWVRVRDDDRIQLRPFPNRVTSYRFELVNQSGRAREVAVQLLAVPRLRPGQRLSREVLLDVSGNLRPSIEMLTVPVKMKLPADKTAKAITFPAPKPPDSGEGAAKPEKGKQPPLKSRIDHGLVCAIRDVAKGEWKWIKWIDFSPLAPKRYLEPKVRYDAVQGKITIDVEAAATEDLPLLSPEQPLKVIWENAHVLGPDTTMEDRGEMAGPGDVTGRITGPKLFADVEPRADKEVPVHLAVDGYPRAFLYRVPCHPDAPAAPIKPVPDPTDVRITVPQDGQRYRIPLPPDSPMRVKFQVDAPEDAFQEGPISGRCGVVELGIDKDGDRDLRPEEIKYSFAGDRQVEIRLQEVRPAGVVKIDAKVRDFTVELDPGGLKNAKVNIVARLLPANRDPSLDPVAASHSVEVILDGAPPEFGRIDLPAGPIPKGKTLRVDVELKDLGGVKEIKIGFDRNKNGKFDADEKPEVRKQPGNDGKWHAELQTKDLQPDTSYRVLIIAADKAGNPPREKTIEVAIGPPVGGTPSSKTSTLTGLALLGGSPRPDISVSLKGDQHTDEQTTGRNGRFTFKEVPPGRYTLQAEGTAKNFPVIGSATVTVPQRPSLPAALPKPSDVTIKLKMK